MSTSDGHETKPSPGASEPAPLTLEEKRRLVLENLAKVEGDLWEGRLEYGSLPRVVDMQLTNFCNMSCTMCYDGNNPPMKKLPPELVERLGAEIFPTASVLVPFSGSEPLIVTWDLARKMAQLYELELDIITNVQFLDEAKFAELEPHVCSVTFSIDSHLPDVYEQIRLRSQPEKVFRNLPVAAKLCREHGIEAQANIVYMVENAPFLDQTVAFLADAGVTTIRLLEYIRMPHLSEERDFSDAATHMSPEWNAWMKDRIRRVAEEKKVRVIFDLREKDIADHLPSTAEFRPDRKESPLTERLRRYYPGYCTQSVDRIKVNVDGRVYPCCMGDAGQLALGNLFEKSFQEIWNGPEARDLRRGMMTGDVPGLCQECSFHVGWDPVEERHLSMVDWFHEQTGGALPRVPEERCTLEVEGPAHLSRGGAPPVFRWRAPERPVDRYALVIAAGGEYTNDNRVVELPGNVTELAMPADAFAALRPNMGYWWGVWAIFDGDPDATLRTATLRCFVRHEDVPRVEGSTLYENARAAGASAEPDQVQKAGSRVSSLGTSGGVP